MKGSVGDKHKAGAFSEDDGLLEGHSSFAWLKGSTGMPYSPT